MKCDKRLAACVVSVLCLFSFLLPAAASDLNTYAVSEGIETENVLRTGEVEVKLQNGQAITAADWETLKDYGEPWLMRYNTLYFRFNDNDMDRKLGASQLNLSPTTPAKALVDAVVDATGLNEEDFMLVLPATVGTLPAPATVGVCLDQTFMNRNGYTDLNVYGIDYEYQTRRVVDESASSMVQDEPVYITVSGYHINQIGLHSSGHSAEKAYSPWISFSTNVSRLYLITTKTISNTSSMTWQASGGALGDAGEAALKPEQSGGAPNDDANPNTGDSAPVSYVLMVGIAALAIASVYTLRRLYVSSHKDR